MNKRQAYAQRQRTEALETFDDFCFHQLVRVKSQTARSVRRVKDARTEANETPDAKIVMTKRGVTTMAGIPMRNRSLLNQALEAAA
jgi:hypothetical protein